MQGTLKIHTENILPIIKKWLYSDKEIFVRELVSNACDAITKRKVLGLSFEPRITITIDKESKTLQFNDSGIGMTAEEVEKYIAQLAFSGAEEFLEKYKGEEPVIGHFGLGFYSAYMVASQVQIDTLSYQEAGQPVLWTCEGTATYTMDMGKRTEIGTTVTLFIDSENAEYLEEFHLKDILQRYCAFLPYPIYLNGEQINLQEPLWAKNPSDCNEAEYRAFYRRLYPMDPDPHFWVHVNVDYPFHLKGILYFPKLHRNFDYQKNQIKLFCNRVFVSDNCQDIIPDYLLALRGAIDSPDIPLNVSRSTLQIDRTVRLLSTHIAKKVADRLVTLHRENASSFQTHWDEISFVMKFGAMQDEKFYERIKECLLWKTVNGDWTTIENKTGTVFYTQELDCPYLKLYKDTEVLVANSPIDLALMSFLEGKKTDLHFQRVDGGIPPTILDSTKEKTLLDSEGKTEAGKIADFFQTTLSIPVEAKSLASDQLPALLSLEEGTRRLRDYMAFTGNEHSLPSKQTFVVNTNSPLIQAIYRLQDADSAKQIYSLTRLAHKELPSNELPSFIEQMTQLLQKLLARQSILHAD